MPVLVLPGTALPPPQQRLRAPAANHRPAVLQPVSDQRLHLEPLRVVWVGRQPAAPGQPLPVRCSPAHVDPTLRTR